MNRLLQRHLRRGVEVVLHLGDAEQVTALSGRVADVDADFIALQRDDSSICIRRIADVKYFELPAPTAAEEMEENPFQCTDATQPVFSAVETPDDEPEAEDTGLFRTDAERDAAKGPRVLGKIDLSNIPDRRHRRNAGYTMRSPGMADSGTMMRPLGYVNRLGVKFGWITPYDNPDKSIYMSLNEIICCDGIVSPPRRGDDVVYTPGRNNVGETAQCVHRVCTFEQQEELIERLSGYDNRNARLLRVQIDDQLSGNVAGSAPAPVEKPAETPKPKREVKVHILPSAPIVVETPKPANELPDRDMPYDEFIARIHGLLDDIAADPSKGGMAHQVLSRGISRARNEGDTAVAMVLCDKALNYFAPDTGSFRYFNSIRENISLFSTREESSEETEESAAGDELPGEEETAE